VSADDLTAGYPVHAVASYQPWTNPHGAAFTDWTASCGVTGTIAGRSFGRAGSARRRELCATCWPLDWSTHHPAPIRAQEVSRG
jgi:hypothetical protein